MKLAMGRGGMLLVALSALLGGCRSDSASYMINGPDHSLTVIVDQDYYWDDQWQLGLVVAHHPECQRRHKLKPVPIKSFKIDVYLTQEGGYVVKEGNNWYIAETQKCQSQQFTTPPALPGELLGSFEFKNDKLSFTALPKPVAPVQPAAAALPAVPGAVAGAAPEAPALPAGAGVAPPAAVAPPVPPAAPVAAPAGR